MVNGVCCMGTRVDRIDNRYASARGTRRIFQRVQIVMDDWASWARRDWNPLGFPKTSSLWRLNKYGLDGAAIPKGYAGLPPIDIPPDVERTNAQLEQLAQIDDAKYYRVVTLSHLERVPDKVLGERLGISRQEVRRRRDIAYAWLDGRLYE